MEVEESVSGFKVIGRWGDVVEHGERITRALRAVDDGNVIDEAALEEWDQWRPKVDEHLDDDLNQKTAEQASVDQGDGEKCDQSPTEDVKTPGEKLSASYESLE